MPDRLAELQRQRALVQQHLAWLDREIASASSVPDAPTASSSAPAPTPSAPGPAPTPPAPTDPTALLEQYRASATDPKTDVRKGCLLYFLAAFAMLGVMIAGFAFYFASRH